MPIYPWRTHDFCVNAPTEQDARISRGASRWREYPQNTKARAIQSHVCMSVWQRARVCASSTNPEFCRVTFESVVRFGVHVRHCAHAQDAIHEAVCSCVSLHLTS